MITFSHNGMFLKQKIFTLPYQYLRYHVNWFCCTLKNVNICHIRYSNETLLSEKHISFVTELCYEAKSHKLPKGKSLVLKSCEFIRSSWLMQDGTFYGRVMAQIC